VEKTGNKGGDARNKETIDEIARDRGFSPVSLFPLISAFFLKINLNNSA
jgi:hypothetical protein